VHAILQNVVEICRGDLESKSFLLELNFAAASRFVNADAARLQQVFWNLLKNAAKFTALGGRISITTQSPAPDGITIAFADNGLGIPPERLSRIFDAFEQGSPAVTQRYGGLGLGLAISKAIVDAHHGSITARSPGPNQGTTFTVELAAFAQAPAVELATPSPDGNYSANVLLVEDHLDTGRLLSRTLTRVGYRVHLATSIASALEVFRAEPIDLIVSDLGLPDGHGTELLEQASAIRPAKAIALSGYGFENDLEATRRAGFLMHLVKPIEPATLQTAIERALSGALANEPAPV
jgi:two-component system CheB/CheR fusion protein